ncbi:hypothetical protein BDV25DRAFT_149047 [Aspergillus avenaceus]|uniref:DUF3074 domain-containing protein n=1 Tax=Aspergillus avenaceus TaxID=36643 RepID=A0A5N6U509_ASPAV|nr:hypothetical protein BDV25DRAFT_149047 [Aspergillus avenaceus]
MADLQAALHYLSATTWDAIPSRDPDALRAYLEDLSAQARLIVESVPEQPPREANPSVASTSPPNNPHWPPAAILSLSNARASEILSAPIATTDSTVPERPLSIAKNPRRNEWSKPIKTSAAKDNPLHLPIYKLPGADGKGHWFSRRSVYSGLPFTRWHMKLSGELDYTLRMNHQQIQKGRPPDRAVRGIGAKRLVEDIEVQSEDGARVLGRVQVYHSSATFPKPTTPRDFVSLVVSWEVVADGFEGGDPGEGEVRNQGTAKGPRARRWMMVSRPCEHPDVPPTQNYIRGQYESVEFIRELPVYEEDAEGDRREEDREEAGGQGEFPKAQGNLNPVEWVMVTRSDPGGNIPRWVVEMGTPTGICQDAVKFLNWACQDDGHKTHARRMSASHPHRHHQHESRAEASAEEDGESESEGSSESGYDSDTEVEHHGLIASFAYLVNAGLERYAPQVVLDYLLRDSSRHSATVSPPQEDTCLTDQTQTPKTEPTATISTTASERPTEPEFNDAASQGTTSVAFSAHSALHSAGTTPDVSAIEQMALNKKGRLSFHEKQLIKLADRKRNVVAQLDRARLEIQALNIDTSSHPPSQADTVEASSNKRNKAPTRARLVNEESKLLKQLGKIEKDQVKEALKIEARHQKHAEKQEKSQSRSETDVRRQEVELLKKEVDWLRSERKMWLDLIGSLQAENTRLVAQQDPAMATAAASRMRLNEERKESQW